MLNYLIAYGVTADAPVYDEIDIIDKQKLEEQLNVSRKRYMDLLSVMDDIDSKLLDVKRRIGSKSKSVLQEAKEKGVRPNELYSTDDDYMALEYEQDALRVGKEMVNAQIGFVQSDLKILNSTFYNKF